MLVDKHTIIGLKDDEIRIDFMQEVMKAIVDLRDKAYSEMEYNKVELMSQVIIKEVYEIREMCREGKIKNEN